MISTMHICLFTQPIAENYTEAGQARNRRAELRILD